ncbi:MAG: class I SAM-dependent methyltransferase [Thermodesulfobacteriota bacterium]
MNRDSNNLGSEELSKIEHIREYWNKNPFEYQVSKSPPGTIDYFRDVESYYSKKYGYLKKYINHSKLGGKKGLDLGCGFGINLVETTKAGAIVIGVDISDLAVEMSKKNLEVRNLNAEVIREDGENLRYKDNSFDFIFAISTVSYTLNPQRMVQEIHRMLKEGSEAYLTVYNTNSWLNTLFKALNKKTPREESPGFNQFSEKEFEQLLKSFSKVEITTDRFPFRTKSDNKIETILFNNLFVPVFNLIPKKLLKSYGHHIIAKVVK